MAKDSEETRIRTAGDLLPRLPLQLGAITVTRTILYTGHRMVYPFLPAIARGLGITLEAAALAITIRSALGILSPLFGAYGDIQGRKRAMLAGILCFISGSLLVASFPNFMGLLLGLVLAGAGLMFFDPAIQAYVGDRVPYERRALGMAAVEFGWSGAFLLGVPVVGVVMERTAWNFPFYGLAGLGAIGFVLMALALPKDVEGHVGTLSLKEGLNKVVTHLPSMAALSVTLIIITGARNIMIIYGAWFESSFGMSVERLGIVSSLIGVAGIAGLISVGAISDALGKRWSMLLGLVMNGMAAIALPFVGDEVPLTIAVLFIFFASFEFSIVTMFSLLSELRPKARATLMAFNAAALSGGDAVGSFIGSRVFQGDIAVNSSISAGLSVIAIFLLLAAVRVER